MKTYLLHIVATGGLTRTEQMKAHTAEDAVFQFNYSAPTGGAGGKCEWVWKIEPAGKSELLHLHAEKLDAKEVRCHVLPTLKRIMSGRGSGSV